MKAITEKALIGDWDCCMALLDTTVYVCSISASCSPANYIPVVWSSIGCDLCSVMGHGDLVFVRASLPCIFITI